MLRTNPLLPIFEKALGAPCGFSEDRRKIYFTVEDTVDGVNESLKKTFDEADIKVDLPMSCYILPMNDGTMVLIEN